MNLYLCFVLIGILILIGLYFVPIKIYGIENFDDYQDLTDSSTFKLTFPPIDELKSKIASIDYFKFFKPSDASARKIDFKLESFRNKYSNSIIPFEDIDKKMVSDNSFN